MPINNILKKCVLYSTHLPILTIPLIALSGESADPSIFGLALQSGPAYIGSDSNKLSAVPIIMMTNGPWFIQTTEGILETGLEHEVTNNFTIGVELAYEDGRSRKDASFLKEHNISNISPSASYGAFLQYENDLANIPFDILLRYRKDIDSARGSQLDLRLTTGIYGGEGKPLNAEVYAQTTYADHNASQYYYGISQTQSATSMLSTFKNSAGFLSSQIGVWASYDMTPHWLLVGDIEASKLLGNSNNSPLVKTDTNTSVMIGIAYKY